MYYTPLVEINDFNALIENKPFFDQLVQNKQQSYEKLVEMSRKDDYKAGHLQKYSPKLLSAHWYRCTKKNKYKYSQQINFIGKLKDDGATIFLLLKCSK